MHKEKFLQNKIKSINNLFKLDITDDNVPFISMKSRNHSKEEFNFNIDSKEGQINSPDSSFIKEIKTEFHNSIMHSPKELNESNKVNLKTANIEITKENRKLRTPTVSGFKNESFKYLTPEKSESNKNPKSPTPKVLPKQREKSHSSINNVHSSKMSQFQKKILKFEKKARKKQTVVNIKINMKDIIRQDVIETAYNSNNVNSYRQIYVKKKTSNNTNDTLNMTNVSKLDLTHIKVNDDTFIDMVDSLMLPSKKKGMAPRTPDNKKSKLKLSKSILNKYDESNIFTSTLYDNFDLDGTKTNLYKKPIIYSERLE